MITIDSMRKGTADLKEAVTGVSKEKFIFAYDLGDGWKIQELLVGCRGFEGTYQVWNGEVDLIRFDSLFFPVQFIPTMIVSAFLARSGITAFDLDTLKILSMPVVFNSKKEVNNG